VKRLPGDDNPHLAILSFRLLGPPRLGSRTSLASLWAAIERLGGGFGLAHNYLTKQPTYFKSVSSRGQPGQTLAVRTHLPDRRQAVVRGAGLSDRSELDGHASLLVYTYNHEEYSS